MQVLVLMVSLGAWAADATAPPAAWRGIPFGPATVLAAAPQADCTEGTRSGEARWVCTEMLDHSAWVISYMVFDNVFLGVMGTSTVGACSATESLLTAAWGPGRVGNKLKTDRFWGVHTHGVLARIWEDAAVCKLFVSELDMYTAYQQQKARELGL